MPRCCGAPAARTSLNPWPTASSRTWRARGSAPAWSAFPSTLHWEPALAAAGGCTLCCSARPSSSSTNSSAPSPCSVSAPSRSTGQFRGHDWCETLTNLGTLLKKKAIMQFLAKDNWGLHLKWQKRRAVCVPEDLSDVLFCALLSAAVTTTDFEICVWKRLVCTSHSLYRIWKYLLKEVDGGNRSSDHFINTLLSWVRRSNSLHKKLRCGRANNHAAKVVQANSGIFYFFAEVFFNLHLHPAARTRKVGGPRSMRACVHHAGQPPCSVKSRS